MTAYIRKDVSLDMAALKTVQPQRPIVGTIYVGLDGHHNWVPLYCGAMKLGKLRSAELMRLEIPPGAYYFHSTGNKGLELDVAAGRSYFLMIRSGLRNHGHIDLLNESTDSFLNRMERIVSAPEFSSGDLEQLRKGR